MSARRRRFGAPGFRPAVVLSATALLAALAVAAGGGAASAYPAVDRIAGATRYATAAQVSATAFDPGVPVAVIATGATFPDALTGGAAAAELGGPVLLVAPDAVPDPVATELRRLTPQRIVVLGGPAAVSDAVLRQLRAFTTGGVSRIFGAGRYQTAAQIAQTVFAPGVATAYVATGADFPDALSGTAAAAATGSPVLLVERDAIPAEVADALRHLAPARIVVLGGPAAVSGAVASALAQFAPTVTRIAGATRYDTAAAVANATFPQASRVFLATGASFPDALAAGPAAGRDGAPVLLVSGVCVPRIVNTAMRRLDYPPITIVGGSLAVSADAAALTPCASAPDGSIGPGVTLRTIDDPAGPFHIKVVTVDPRAASTVDVALAGDALPGLETTSSMARRYGAVAAINGDFAAAGGRPVHLFADDGRLDETGLEPSRNFSYTPDQAGTRIGVPATHIRARVPDTGAFAGVDRVNSGPPGADQLALFTPSGGGLESPPGNACSARLTADEPAHVGPTGDAVQDHVVASTGCAGPPAVADGADVLSAPIGGSRAAFVQALVPGQHVTISWSVGLPGALDSIGGGPVLVHGGAVNSADVDGSGGFFGRNPRTGVGVTASGEILLVTVDGRDRDTSMGMTLREFAELFRRLGATDALNLDGGGSTTMVVEGAVQNQPSDGVERAVSSALLVLPGADPDEGALPSPSPSASPSPSSSASPSASPSPSSSASPSASVSPFNSAHARSAGPAPAAEAARFYDAMVGDPGSVGGFADAQRRAGAALPPDLAHAATSFERSR